MKDVVVDANVVALWFIREDRSSTARAVSAKAGALAAPDVLLAEVTNVIWKNDRPSTRITDEEREFIDAISQRVRIIGSSKLSSPALQIARDLDHPVYDAYYIALALREGLPFVTFDDRIVRKTRGTAYEPVVIGALTFTSHEP